ncbi:exodeoxyribonuclease V subunit alpha [Enterobacteriaceae endosymbiont of Donacia bicoloricornis]|uniref:exodeoxyribonuclease V subunit alpha n=1 Tax=Enterobacteriaceae endosymbiont of Donacia bicoloricornis TaxID=2675772 RepID=UPI001449E016|nr:exodeoxyribonuclease V subunit alpha [Enterobacteriaceae endosymbiont of Donacia bicoloricornis]QJC37907.1 exodeoxyribonuclease V subunit alpha [Enterobacteriaceae endosymbiont of Donacia bicoloricornis]
MQYFFKKLCEIGVIRLTDFYFASILTSKKQKFLKYSIALLSNSISKGNVCLPISKLYLDIKIKNQKNTFFIKKIKEINQITNWKKILLLNTEIINNGNYITPIILENNCLYLHKIWNEENIIVENFIKNNVILIDQKKIKNILKILFINENKNTSLEKQAICAALTHRISIINGSPGTGKTSIVSKIIFTFIKIFNNPLKIKIAATTGKASARLTQSVNYFFKKISLNLINKNEKKNIPSKGTTIHNLLKIKIYTKETSYNDKNTLDLDLLIIDEASMIDFNLMSIILKALSKKTKLVLLGDEYQLPPIEGGNMFKDLCYFKKFFFTKKYFKWLNIINNNKVKKNYNIPSFFFRNFITVLKYNFRYLNNSGINKLALIIKKGEIKKIKKLFLSKKYKDINLIDVINDKQYKLMINSFIHEYKKYFIFLQKSNNHNDILQKFNCYQIICAIKHGLFGTKMINNIIEKELFNEKILINNITYHNWYIGRPIIITQNSNFLNLFNGDIGITFFDKNDKKLKIKFLLANGKYQIISIKNLPPYNIAYAITTHKAQGSEFQKISLVLPNKLYPILTRELIYTAITRAKKKINIYSHKLIFYKAIKLKIKRFSNIKRKIFHYMKKIIYK